MLVWSNNLQLPCVQPPTSLQFIMVEMVIIFKMVIMVEMVKLVEMVIMVVMAMVIRLSMLIIVTIHQSGYKQDTGQTGQASQG